MMPAGVCLHPTLDIIIILALTPISFTVSEDGDIS